MTVFRSAAAHDDWRGRLCHLAYATGWKKFEPLWDAVIRLQRVANFRPLLEALLNEGQTVAIDQEQLAGARISRRPSVTPN